MIESLRADFRALDSSERRLRRFGWAVGTVLLLAALAFLWHGDWVPGRGARWLAAGGGALVALAFVAPATLRPLYQGWMGLALVLGHVMTRVLLTLVFFLLVTPIGLLRRALARDPLEKAPAPELGSYWIRRAEGKTAARLERYW